MRPAANIPADLHGRTVIVTGANAGLGFQTALQLGERGAHVVLACRSQERAELAQQKLRQAAPAGVYETAQLNLSDLESVRAFVAECRHRFSQIHMLCNNAGVIGVPYSKSPQGHEQHMATNFFGPFALTGLLLDQLIATPSSRIVNISSQIHRLAKLSLDDLNWANRKYKPMAAYGQSKLAITSWSLELHRRLQRHGIGVTALMAHPGFAVTDMPAQSRVEQVLGDLFKPVIVYTGLVQTASDAARCSLYALTAPDVQGGDYVGPSNWLGSAGVPMRATASPEAADPALAKVLWERSAQVTGVSYLD